MRELTRTQLRTFSDCQRRVQSPATPRLERSYCHRRAVRHNASRWSGHPRGRWSSDDIEDEGSGEGEDEENLSPSPPSFDSGRTTVTVHCWFPARPPRQRTVTHANPPRPTALDLHRARNAEAVQELTAAVHTRPLDQLYPCGGALARQREPLPRPGFRAKRFGMGYLRVRELADSRAHRYNRPIASQFENRRCVHALRPFRLTMTLLTAAHMYAAPQPKLRNVLETRGVESRGSREGALVQRHLGYGSTRLKRVARRSSCAPPPPPPLVTTDSRSVVILRFLLRSAECSHRRR